MECCPGGNDHVQINCSPAAIIQSNDRGSGVTCLIAEHAVDVAVNLLIDEVESIPYVHARTTRT